MSGFARALFAFTLVLTLAVAPGTAFSSERPKAYYFLAAVHNDEGCFLRSFFMLDPYWIERSRSKPKIEFIEIKGKLVFKSGKSINFPQVTGNKQRGVQFSGGYPLPLPCEDFLYFEIIEAHCTINWLGPLGGIEDMRTEEHENCLGDMPRRVGLTGSFTPDEPNMLMPLTIPPPAQ